MDKPLISVILCFLNPGNWLKEAIDSVIAQTYEHWELILVDDGSVTMDSLVAQAFAEGHPNRIKYTDHDDHRNIGLTASRNVGVGLANGSLIAFLDADDFWYSQKLTYQFRLFQNFPDAQMICEASQFWYSWNDCQHDDPVISIGAPEGLYNPGQLIKLLYPLGEGQPPCPSGVILKKDALARSGVFEESFSGVYQLYEDQAFLAKMYLNEVIYVSAVANNKYRKHNHSMSSAANDSTIYCKVRNFYLDWLENYLEKQGIVCLDLQRLISAARLPLANADPE